MKKPRQQIRMTKEIRNPNDEIRKKLEATASAVRGCKSAVRDGGSKTLPRLEQRSSDFVIRASFVIRHSSFVISVALVLAGCHKHQDPEQAPAVRVENNQVRSEEHTSELQSPYVIS